MLNSVWLFYSPAGPGIPTGYTLFWRGGRSLSIDLRAALPRLSGSSRSALLEGV